MNPIDAALAGAWEVHKSGDPAAAEAAYRQAIEQAPAHAKAWCYLGLACHDQGRPVEAEQAYRHALRLAPQFPIALNNLGNSLKLQGRLEEAIACFERAIEQDAGYVSAHFNLGVTRLLQGDDERGWPEFLWRERMPAFAGPQIDAPRWQGEPLDGKTILLWAEQGLGDTLQFVRYAPFARQRGGRAIVAVQKPLLALLGGCAGTDELVSLEEAPGLASRIDFHAPLMSLPAMVGVDGEKGAPPSAGGVQQDATIPYLQADAQRAERWKEKLAAVAGYKVGIAWAGNPRHADDRRRSVPLEMFEPLAALAGVRLVNLQKGPGSEQVALTGGRVPLVHLGEELDAGGAFTDTAAVISQLDLVIAADTAVAHLAGALGVPVWLALSSLPDWRWRISGETTRWYPSMRLVRQSRPGQWEDVFDRMAAALAERVATRQPCGGGSPSTAGRIAGRIAVRESGPALAAWRRDRRLSTADFCALKQTRHGPMLYNRFDTYIGRSLEEYGEFSQGEIDLLRQLVKPGDVMIEAGANIGAHTLPLAQMVGDNGEVQVFEPQRVLFQTLCANVALGALTNVHARQAALGAAPGAIVVPALDYRRPNNFGGLALAGLEVNGDQPGERVPLMTIDGLELPRVDLIKADVEGMEADVLRGARETIARHRPILYVENDREESSAALIELIASLGYRLYWHRPPLYRAQNFFANPVNVFGNVVSQNMLCLHASVPAQIQGLEAVR